MKETQVKIYFHIVVSHDSDDDLNEAVEDLIKTPLAYKSCKSSGWEWRCGDSFPSIDRSKPIEFSDLEPRNPKKSNYE